MGLATSSAVCVVSELWWTNAHSLRNYSVLVGNLLTCNRLHVLFCTCAHTLALQLNESGVLLWRRRCQGKFQWQSDDYCFQIY
jgi:hypothetical protein